MTTIEATEITTTTLEDPTALAGMDWADADAMYPDWRGLNYVAGRPVKEIAAIVRRELRKAVKAGTLGDAIKVNVRCRDHNAIDVDIIVPKVRVTADTPGAILARDTYGDEVWVIIPDEATYATPGATDRLIPGARDAKAKVEAFLATFNYNRSNTMVDYFDTNFYTGVTLHNPEGGWE